MNNFILKLRFIQSAYQTDGTIIIPIITYIPRIVRGLREK